MYVGIRYGGIMYGGVARYVGELGYLGYVINVKT